MDNFSLSVICAASWGALYYYGFKSEDQRSEISYAKSQSVRSPEALLKIFKLPDVQEILAKQEGSHRRHPHEYRGLTFIEGVVACDKPIESIHYKDVKLVHRVAYKEDIYSNSRLIEGTDARLGPKKDVEINAPLYFNLVDPFTQDSCKVHRSMQANTRSALEEISTRQVKRDLGWLEKGLVYLGLSLEFIRSVMNLTMMTRGIKIGWSEKELGIKVGSTLTVYGEVIYNAVEGKLRIETPLFYVLEKRNVIEEMKRQLDVINTKWGMVLIPALISMYFLVKRFVHYRLRLNPRRPKDKLSWMNAVKLKDNYICIKCGKKPRNVIMEPCQDLCLCSDCYELSEKKACPICGTSVKSGVEIFFT